MSCNFCAEFSIYYFRGSYRGTDHSRDVIAQNDTQMVNLVRESVSNTIHLCRHLILPEFILYHNFIRNLHGGEENIVSWKPISAASIRMVAPC